MVCSFNERNYYEHELGRSHFSLNLFLLLLPLSMNEWMNEQQHVLITSGGLSSWMTVFSALRKDKRFNKVSQEWSQSTQSPLTRNDPDIISMVMIIVSWNVQWDIHQKPHSDPYQVFNHSAEHHHLRPTISQSWIVAGLLTIYVVPISVSQSALLLLLESVVREKDFLWIKIRFSFIHKNHNFTQSLFWLSTRPSLSLSRDLL